MYPTAVICIFWLWDSFCVARRFWLPCHISKTLWTLAIQCNFLCCASLFISMRCSVLGVSNAGSSPVSHLLLAWANWVTTTLSRRVLPVVFDCLHLITSCPREKLASTPTPGGMIENMLRDRFERSAYFECVSSCWRHQLVISGNLNILLFYIGSE